MELAITIAVIVLSILVGFGLYQGGEEIKSVNIRMAGVCWLLIIALYLISLAIQWYSANGGDLSKYFAQQI